jgi:hypothetical protein
MATELMAYLSNEVAELPSGTTAEEEISDDEL